MVHFSLVFWKKLQITEKYSPQNGRDYEHHNGNSGTGPVPAKRYCEPSQSNGDMPTTAPSGTNGHAPINGRPPINGASAGQGANLRSLPYPHSMPTSPTMFERGNEVRLVSISSKMCRHPVFRDFVTIFLKREIKVNDLIKFIWVHSKSVVAPCPGVHIKWLVNSINIQRKNISSIKNNFTRILVEQCTIS